jgi:hypothetical protein
VDAGPSAPGDRPSSAATPGPTPPNRRGALGSYRGGSRPQPEQPQPQPEPQPQKRSTPPPNAAGDLPSRDELTKAWGDEILGRLRGRTRALYAAGRFTSVDGGRAQFALPDANHRDQCEVTRADVEAALASHFGRPVPLELVTETGSGTTAPRRTEPEPEPEDDVTDYAAIADLPTAPPPDAATPTDRIKSAFPGAEEVQ